MSRKSISTLRIRNPVAVGTGLVALDVVIDVNTNHSPWLWTGGTCGNVLTILSYLGWQAFPIGRLNGDSASRRVEGDLKRWGVHLDFAKLKPASRTPIVVHRIAKTSSGIPFHRFSWTCPNCGSWLPGYQPVLASAAKKIVSQFGAPKVFFLDRVSRGALILAKACAELGALIFFEPSGFGEPRLFKEAYAMAHVLKYSHERVRSSHGIANSGPFLEIETLGAEGLRYRSKIKGARSNGWEQLEAYEILDLKDTAGAGDWCSAGIIHKLAQKGLNGLLQTRKSQLQEAFRFGQALATWNCSYEGARGGMYAVDKRTFRRQVQGIMSRNGAKVLKREIPTPTVRKIFERICPNCTPDPCSKRKTNR